MVKLTKRTVDALRPKPGKDVLIWDSELKGFGVRAKPSGVKSWILQYRNKHGRSRRLTLGSITDLTPVQAREMAEIHRGEIRKGADPVETRKGDRNAITVSELCEEYMEAGKGRIKDSTLYNDRGRIDNHIKPLLGNKVVAGLTSKDVEKFIQDVSTGKTAVKPPPAPKGAKGRKRGKRPRGGVTRGGPAAAARATELLGTILERAVRDKVILVNPVHGVPRPPGIKRRPLFSFEAVTAVGKAMREIRQKEIEEAGKVRPDTEVAHNAVTHIILSGSRRTEALTLQGPDIDPPNHCMNLRDSKATKQGEIGKVTKMRPLGQAALNHLASFRPKTAAPRAFLFPGKGKAGHFVGLPKVWARIAKKAGVTKVSLHGLRHWYGNAAAEMNYADPNIAPVIGHSRPGTTSRYANAPDSAIVVVADRVSQRLWDALEGRESGKVLKFNA